MSFTSCLLSKRTYAVVIASLFKDAFCCPSKGRRATAVGHSCDNLIAVLVHCRDTTGEMLKRHTPPTSGVLGRVPPMRVMSPPKTQAQDARIAIRRGPEGARGWNDMLGKNDDD